MSTMDALNDCNRQLIEEYRATGGKVTGQFAGAPLLLLTTTGARSGRLRTNPLAYSRDGDRLVVIASKGGASTNPDWYCKLVAHPATVELGSERVAVWASFPQGEKHQRLYYQQAAQMPGFAEYQRNTTRQIPVSSSNGWVSQTKTDNNFDNSSRGL